jgi:transcription elongation factor GreB
MSRAFVNEDDLAENVTLPERQVSAYPNYVTPRGLVMLEQCVSALVGERSTLRKDTDSAARERLAEVERDLRYYTARVESARLVPMAVQAPEKIAFGCRVTVATPDGDEIAYTLVGEDEADAERGLVSWVSPLGKALLGAQEGNVVLWKRPAGAVELEVVEIGLPEKSD